MPKAGWKEGLGGSTTRSRVPCGTCQTLLSLRWRAGARPFWACTRRNPQLVATGLLSSKPRSGDRRLNPVGYAHPGRAPGFCALPGLRRVLALVSGRASARSIEDRIRTTPPCGWSKSVARPAPGPLHRLRIDGCEVLGGVEGFAHTGLRQRLCVARPAPGPRARLRTGEHEVLKDRIRTTPPCGWSLFVARPAPGPRACLRIDRHEILR